MPAEPPGPRLPIEQRLGPLRWPVIGRLGIHPSGEERSRGRGVGLEYADVREYVPGDDPRMMDWNLTARSGRPFVRLAHPDRGIDSWILFDVSASLDWGTALCLKREAAADYAAAAVTLLARRGNRVGALLFDDTVTKVLPPTTGRRSRAALLAAVRGPAGSAPAPHGLASAFAAAARLIKRRSLVLIVSDFLADDAWQLPLRTLALRHEVVVAVVTDPREADIPDVGLVTFEDPESGEQVEVDTRNRQIRERFAAAAAARTASVYAAVRAAGALAFPISTDQDVLFQLIRLFDRLHAEARARRSPA